jgi:hypothetical protein
VLARHSNHHTNYHRNALLDVAIFIFMVCVAKGWGIRYTGSWTLAYLVDHPELLASGLQQARRWSRFS